MVAEVNFGAALVADVIGLTAKAKGLVVPFDEVRASRGKRVRAEPVAALYHAGQGRCHHVGVFPQLEEQMTFWTPKDPTSPDRMDALVWACSYLIPDLMLPPAEFAAWFRRFLPEVPKTLREPATVTDRSDPQIVHLDGLNLSRAWCLRGVAGALPEGDPLRKALAESAARHAEAGLAHVASGDYVGEHWLASFAVYLLTAS